MLGNIDITRDTVNHFEYERIGKPNERNLNRLLKVNTGDNEIRERIINEAKKLKLLQNPWKLVYINRDSHPVYLKENQRIRKVVQDLKKQPGFEHETNRVKLVKGHVKVDDVTVDKNLFLA